MREKWKYVIGIPLVFFVLFGMIPVSAANTGNLTAQALSPSGHGLMHLTPGQRGLMQQEINNSPHYHAPRVPAAQGTMSLFSSSSINTSATETEVLPQASYSILSALPYIPSQRDQGVCGNCWVWASTGAMEVDHTVTYNVSDRLSIQYFDSKYQSETGSSACSGGGANAFADWYTTDQSPIPWTNTNASYADYKTSGKTTVAISSIATALHYQLSSVTDNTIDTYSEPNATAINNIKSAINNKKAVILMFFMNSNGWTAFDSFWAGQPETAIFDPTLYSSGSEDGGHAVLIVGYDDKTDPANPYWLVVNSWGAPSNRPDGTFRLSMNMNYNSSIAGFEQEYFQIFDTGFSAGNVVPAVSSVSPVSEQIPATSPVTVTGIGFTGATKVLFGKTPASSFTVASDSQLTVTPPVASTSGTVDVTVVTARGTSAITTADRFTYVAKSAVIANVTPGSGPLTGMTVVTITGVGFSGATNVSFGNLKAASFTVNSATSITAITPASGSPSAVNVTVTTPYGPSAANSSAVFTYYVIPAVTGMSARLGPLTGGTSTLIVGNGFSGATAVMFGSVKAASFRVNSANTITAISPPSGSAGTVDVTVVNSGGTSAISSADKFTYVSKPVITSISPAQGPQTGNTTVQIYGTGFAGTSSVMFGSVKAASFAVDSSSRITAVSPASASASTVDITVTTVGGTSVASAADRFAY